MNLQTNPALAANLEEARHSETNQLHLSGESLNVAARPSALLIAAGWERPQAVKALLNSGSGPDEGGSGQVSPLHIATARGRNDIISLLLAGGAKPSPQGHWDRETPLHLAAYHGFVKTAELLISKGADVEARCSRGVRPLHVAMDSDKPAVAKLLLAKGANVEAKTDRGNSPLHIAARKAGLSTCQLLLQHGAKVNAKNKIGWTPLHAAAHACKPEVVELLLAKGADKTIKGTAGETPLDAVKAISRGRHLPRSYGEARLLWAARRIEVIKLLSRKRPA